eukprot:c5469_g1_i1.p1 GENE.c5469_g1_i1~~c5469_g1_i1.p1  ORF type:complete len:467 (+),score=135.75 c5469_g1_i1:83-1402(+)
MDPNSTPTTPTASKAAKASHHLLSLRTTSPFTTGDGPTHSSYDFGVSPAYTAPSPITPITPTTPTNTVASSSSSSNSVTFSSPTQFISPSHTKPKFTPFVGYTAPATKTATSSSPAATSDFLRPKQQFGRGGGANNNNNINGPGGRRFDDKNQHPARPKRWEMTMGRTAFLGGELGNFASSPAPRTLATQVTAEEGAPPDTDPMNLDSNNAHEDNNDDDAMNLGMVDVDFAPVTLPLAHPLSQELKNTQKMAQTDWVTGVMAGNTMAAGAPPITKHGKHLLGRGKDELFLIQLPSHLPIPSSAETSTATATSSSATTPQPDPAVPLATESPKKQKKEAQILALETRDSLEIPNATRRVPAGYAGKVRIYRSGRVEMVLGNVRMDVVEGARCNFTEEVLQVDSEGREVNVLGAVTRHIVCMPSVNTMVNSNNPLHNESLK